MEKRIVHHDLAAVILLVRARKAAAFTKTAIDGGRQMGLTMAEMIDAVCTLTPRHFFKSMTTYADTPVGKAYVKVTMRTDGAPVIQFKEL